MIFLFLSAYILFYFGPDYGKECTKSEFHGKETKESNFGNAHPPFFEPVTIPVVWSSLAFSPL